MKHLVLLLAVNIAMSSCLHAQTSIDSQLVETMRKEGIVGMAATIIINKKTAWKKGYGFANREKGIPFTTSTIMNIASVTKTITGACMMKAVEQGKLSLDEDINTYLPFKVINPWFPAEKITLRQIATHTSGLADRFPFYSDSTYFNEKDSPEPLGDFLRNYFVKGGKHYTDSNYLQYRPGTYREYSNIAAGLAGYIVERVTGQRLDQYSQQQLFRPLGMTHTSWFLAATDTSRHTRLYEKTGDSIQSIPLYGLTTYPDGGIHTSVDDLTRFFVCLLNGGKTDGRQVLDHSLVDEMTRLQFSETHKPENVKLAKLNSGLFWATKMGGSRLGHNGSDPGVRTFMLTDKTGEIAVVLFFNTALPEKQEGVYFDIYERLYAYGKTLLQKPGMAK